MKHSDWVWKNILFWEDHWLGNGPFCSVFPHLYCPFEVTYGGLYLGGLFLPSLSFIRPVSREIFDVVFRWGISQLFWGGGIFIFGPPVCQ